MDTSRSKKLVLAIDDEPQMLSIIEDRLKAGGYDVITALNGEEGLRKAKANMPDVIVLDIMMPDISGTEVAWNLRQDEALRNTPIIFLTCLVEKEELKNISEIDNNSFLLAKPFEEKELISLIEKVTK